MAQNFWEPSSIVQGCLPVKSSSAFYTSTQVVGSDMYSYHSSHLIALNLQGGPTLHFVTGWVCQTKESVLPTSTFLKAPHAPPDQFYPQYTPKMVCALWRLCLLEQKRSHHKLQLPSLPHILPERWRLHECQCLSGREQTRWNTGVNGKGRESQVSWISSPAHKWSVPFGRNTVLKKVNQNFSLIVFKHDPYLRGRNTGT